MAAELEVVVEAAVRKQKTLRVPYLRTKTRRIPFEGEARQSAQLI